MNESKSFFTYSNLTGLLSVCWHLGSEMVALEKLTAKVESIRTKVPGAEHFQSAILPIDSEFYLLVVLTEGGLNGLTGELKAEGLHDLTDYDKDPLGDLFSLSRGPGGIESFEACVRQWALNCSMGLRA